MTPTIKDLKDSILNEENRDGYASWYPNSPDIGDYIKHAEKVGFITQQIVCISNSTGCYYEVYALYDGDKIFGRKPVALLFEDYSKSVPRTWIAEIND